MFEYHTRTVLSSNELVATYLASGEKAKAAMAPVCPYIKLYNVNKETLDSTH